jgi:rieske iron-sulfur protein
MIGSFAPLFPFLQGSVGQVSVTTQVIEDLKTGAPIKTSDIKPNSFSIFIWPRTGNPAVDADSFRQCVVIHLPSGLTAPSDLSAVDPLTNDTFIAFSRVCLHLWCLWNYIGTDQRMECPCHGSQYVPGTGQYPNFTQASNQPPGKAVAGPASLQTPPNNTLPIIKLSIAADGTISATSIVGQVGCGQLC